MAIDIDSFLNKFENGDKKELIENKNKKKNNLDLDFQKDVENKIKNLKELGLSTQDYDLLFKIYSQLKNFDEDILNKLYGIEKSGVNTLKELGEKYSKKFSEEVLKQEKLLETVLNSKILETYDLIKNNRFSKVYSNLLELEYLFEKYPKYFLENRNKKRYEIIILKQKYLKTLESYKSSQLFILKNKIKTKIVELNKFILNKSLSFNENEMRYIEIKNLINSIDPIFYSDLVIELKAFNNISNLYNEYELKESKRLFQEIKKDIFKLIDKFHQNYVEQNLEKTITTYDEIVILFNKLPDNFLEEKISIYNKIIELYSSIDDLVVKSSVNLFVSSYNSSKIIDEVRLYLDTVKVSKIVNVNTINKLIEKVEKLPESHKLEKIKLLEKLNKIKSIPLTSTNQDFNEKKTKENSNYNHFYENKQKNFENIFENINLNNSNYNVLKELKNLYSNFQHEKSPSKLKLLYKKIIFYIDLLNISNDQKTNLKNKVKQIILNKKI
jgi:hypothetical protein